MVCISSGILELKVHAPLTRLSARELYTRRKFAKHLGLTDGELFGDSEVIPLLSSEMEAESLSQTYLHIHRSRVRRFEPLHPHSLNQSVTARKLGWSISHEVVVHPGELFWSSRVRDRRYPFPGRHQILFAPCS
jgi:hypothetical protein